jgi:hypothetical protein
MTVAEPPETTPNTPVITPDQAGEGQIDQNIRYDDDGNYLYTIGGTDDPHRDT